MAEISGSEVKAGFMRAARELGWDGFTYTYTISQEWTDPGAHYVQVISPSAAQFMREYRTLGLDKNLARYSRARSDLPELFDLHSYPDTKADRQMVELLRRHGFLGGLAIPLYGFGGALGLSCFLSKEPAVGANLMARTLAYVLPLQMRMNALSRALIEKADAVKTLTAREFDCLSLVAEGMTSREISGSVGISVRTVEFHIQNALHKLNCSSRSQAASRLMQLGTMRPVHA